MINFMEYILGLLKGFNEGTRHVILESDAYTFTDTGSDGNIVIEEAG